MATNIKDLKKQEGKKMTMDQRINLEVDLNETARWIRELDTQKATATGSQLEMLGSIQDGVKALMETYKQKAKEYGYKAVYRCGEWIVGPDLYSIKFDAMQFDLPEDPRIYGF